MIKGTICAVEPSKASCLDTGDSGSGLVMERFQGGYSWEGALSFYRGCDQPRLDGIRISFGENPGVFTEGSCYLPWIAESYGMQLGEGLSTGCRPASGDIEDRDKKECKAFNGENCDFNSDFVFNFTSNGIEFAYNGTGIGWTRCLFLGQGFTQIEMSYVCQTTSKELSTCANNCLGVEASDIVAGGTAILSAAAISSVSLPIVSPAAAAIFGIGGLGLAGMGAVSMMGCFAPFYCVTTQGTCCLVVMDIVSGIVCPTGC